MSLSIGIVGLPNVGKSTLFNALLKRQIADVGEYPFTTVEPNTGVVEVRDNRLDQLAEVLKIDKKVPAVVKFYDIAGLIKGAHEGEGLGNQFLNHIRSVDAILHLVRGFASKNIPHVRGEIDPVLDISIINLELALADFEQIKKILKNDKKLSKETRKVLDKLLKGLEAGKMALELGLDKSELEQVREYNLLSLKPMFYALNLDESGVVDFKPQKDMPMVMILSAKLEAEIDQLSRKDKKEYLNQLGLKESLLDRLIKNCYQLLGLITFFTVKGGNQVQAWPLKRNRTVIQAAEVIHTDFKKDFKKAEVIDWHELVVLKSWTRAKEAGKVRLVSRDYQVQNGEVVEIKI